MRPVSYTHLDVYKRQLEEEVGAPLTVKRVGQLELSPAGRLFLKRARAIVKLVEVSCLLYTSSIGAPSFASLHKTRAHTGVWPMGEGWRP